MISILVVFKKICKFSISYKDLKVSKLEIKLSL